MKFALTQSIRMQHVCCLMFLQCIRSKRVIEGYCKCKFIFISSYIFFRGSSITKKKIVAENMSE